MTMGNALHTVKTVGAKYILVPSLLGANKPLKLSFAQQSQDVPQAPGNLPPDSLGSGR